MNKYTNRKLSSNFFENLEVVLNKQERCFVKDPRHSNTKYLALRSRACDGLLRGIAKENDTRLTLEQLKFTNDELEAKAFYDDKIIDLKVRVASDNNSVVIDSGDSKNTRIRLANGKYEIIDKNDNTPFISNPSQEAICLPGRTSILDHFYGLINLSKEETLLLLGWITYVLAHPKEKFTTYPILSFRAEQGMGKSSACRILRKIVDPRNNGIQKLPTKIDDLAIMAESSHLLIFDNVRRFSADIADTLCITSTGGSRSKRKLYSDSDEVLQNLQVALILNGIHGYIEQPDLAERTINLNLTPIQSKDRKTEEELNLEFEAILPSLMGGIFTLTAKTLDNLSKAITISPERMFDFCKWLSATELALAEVETYSFEGIQTGDIQNAYSKNLKAATLDNLLENELAAAILDFAQSKVQWSGTPTQLLLLLNEFYEEEYTKSRYWPQSPIALSKRLKPLTVSLLSQGVSINFTRGEKRKITLKREYTTKKSPS
jgi:hypothetical protein